MKERYFKKVRQADIKLVVRRATEEVLREWEPWERGYTVAVSTGTAYWAGSTFLAEDPVSKMEAARVFGTTQSSITKRKDEIRDIVMDMREGSGVS